MTTLNLEDFADTIFFNGPIVTVNGGQPEVEALAVRDGRIQRIGAMEDVLLCKGPDTQLFDLEGRALLPGFVEAHGHPLLSALYWGDPVVDIRAIHTPTYEAAMAKVRRRVAKAKPDEMLWFLGLDPQLHQSAREPSKAELDEISPEVPIAVQTSNLHALYVNTAMLKRLGITRDTPVVPGGHITPDENGEPWRFEERSREFIIESFYAYCGEKRGLDSLKEWLWKFSRAGYTTSSEMGVTPLTDGFYRKIVGKESMPIRVFGYQRSIPEGTDTVSFEGGDDHFSMLGIKLWGDGSILLGNVWTSRPYLNTEMTIKSMGLPEDSTGKMNYSPEELHRIVMAYASRGHQISVHAQGDRTIDAVLDVFEAALAAYPDAARPFRMEHCSFIRADQIERAHKLGVVCSFFLPHFYYWGDALSTSLVGEDAAAHSAPSGTATRSGMRVSYHCDAPMTWPNALLCLYIATTRRTRSGRVLGPDERVDIDAALKAVTIDAAYQLRKEDRIGSLEVGKYADLVMLDRNPRETPSEDLLGLKVLGTFVRGQAVWHKYASEVPTAMEIES